MSEVDEMNGVCYIDDGSGIIVTTIRNKASFISFADDNIGLSDYPFYGAILMNRGQLQQIIDNKHLFDTGLVNAAYLVLISFENHQLANHIRFNKT